MSKSSAAKVSVVVCTLDRSQSLADTLDSLAQLQGLVVEVVVVAGPSQDATNEVLDQWQGKIKLVHNDAANLSASRNLGIAAAAGEFIAFLDDDAVADPWWLIDLIEVFEDPEVMATGGPTRGPDGIGFQAVTSFSDRFGNATAETLPSVDAAPYLCRPFAPRLAYPIGTNLIARRSALVAIGGFDEALAFYLDEVDLVFRLADRGGLVTVSPRGEVTHRFLPSTARNTAKIVTKRYDILRSRRYFAKRFATDLYDEASIEDDFADFLKLQRKELDELLAKGDIATAVRLQFEEDVVRAEHDALELLQEPRQTQDRVFFSSPPDFLIFAESQNWPLRIVVGKDLDSSLSPEGVITEFITTDANGARRIFEQGHYISYLPGERYLHELADRIEQLSAEHEVTLENLPSEVEQFLS
ncbi:MAG: glycosyltransferase family 2 protein, partial [Actinobacteria bacterium]|nr:glycosyltransferase family 2 protein [Actinomycetota bacterium]